MDMMVALTGNMADDGGVTIVKTAGHMIVSDGNRTSGLECRDVPAVSLGSPVADSVKLTEG
jgi:hypothetical protein